jgi:hypothetical protein
MLDRSKPRGGMQVTPIVMTYIVSSIWHGTYPGFFILFIMVAILDV